MHASDLHRRNERAIIVYAGQTEVLLTTAQETITLRVLVYFP